MGDALRMTESEAMRSAEQALKGNPFFRGKERELRDMILATIGSPEIIPDGAIAIRQWAFERAASIYSGGSVEDVLQSAEAILNWIKR